MRGGEAVFDFGVEDAHFDSSRRRERQDQREYGDSQPIRSNPGLCFTKAQAHACSFYSGMLPRAGNLARAAKVQIR